MNKLFLLLLFFTLHCMQNLADCNSFESKCSNSENEITNLRLLGLVSIASRRISSSGSIASSGSLSGKASEFYTILVSYRSNGSYTLASGTTRTFLNSSRCSGSTMDHSALNRAAQKHTESMIQFNYFSHTGQDGSSPSDRVRAEGLNVGAGENIAAGYSTAESAFDGWWNSSGHRSNMENCNYTHVGIGYANKSSINASASYGDYWTNVFATIR
jgi:hypothetical protein